MGIGRKIIFIFLLLSVSRISAQNNTDTIYISGNKFVEHIVKAGESLRSISQLHKVKTKDIKQSNKLERRLYYNQILYIPIYLNEKKKIAVSSQSPTSKNKKYNTNKAITKIALLSPYYLLENEAFDSLDTYYNQSEAALSFHIGVELAIDSLRRAGKNIMLYTFDTGGDSSAVQRLVYSNKLNQMDIIIGPMYSNLFQIVCKRYGKYNNKTLISPLSRDNQRIKKFPSVYQIALTHKIQADILMSSLIKNKFNERILILHDNNELSLASYLMHRFKKNNKAVDTHQISHTNVDSIRRFFVDSQNVVLLSRDKVFISTMLGSIGSIDSSSTIYTFESVSSYDNLDITNLMELDVHIPSSRQIDFSNHYDLTFMSLFEKEYSTNFRRYSKQGYDIIMHFCGDSDIYIFKQNKNGYYENIHAPIYHYVDYQLVPLN